MFTSRLSKKKRMKAQQARYLSQSLLLEEGGNLKLVIFSIALLCTLISLLLYWAYLVKIDEIAVAKGEVIPATQIQHVQHLEGGIVETIAFPEGEHVNQGDVVISLNSAPVFSELEKLYHKEIAVILDLIRLRAFLNDDHINYTARANGVLKHARSYDQKDNSMLRLIRDQQALLHYQMTARDDQREAILDKIAQKKNELTDLASRKGLNKEQVELLNKEKAIYDNLRGTDTVSEITYIDMKRKVNEASTKDKQLEEEKSRISGGLSELRNKLYELNSHYKEQTLKEIHEKDAELLEIRTGIHKLVDRAKRLKIRAPIAGIIKGLKVAEGSVIASGAIVFDVVPLDNKMIVEVKINPRDIGHMKVGDPVNVKVTSYDYAKYGAIDGKLTLLSASTFTEKATGSQYYKGIVALTKNYVGHDRGAHHVIPGMVVVADINTGKKSMLDYLLKPINRALDNAFNER